jgi:hypothetical protein
MDYEKEIFDLNAQVAVTLDNIKDLQLENKDVLQEIKGIGTALTVHIASSESSESRESREFREVIKNTAREAALTVIQDAVKAAMDLKTHDEGDRVETGGDKTQRIKKWFTIEHSGDIINILKNPVILLPLLLFIGCMSWGINKGLQLFWSLCKMYILKI